MLCYTILYHLSPFPKTPGRCLWAIQTSRTSGQSAGEPSRPNRASIIAAKPASDSSSVTGSAATTWAAWLRVAHAAGEARGQAQSSAQKRAEPGDLMARALSAMDLVATVSRADRSVSTTWAPMAASVTPTKAAPQPSSRTTRPYFCFGVMLLAYHSVVPQFNLPLTITLCLHYHMLLCTLC